MAKKKTDVLNFWFDLVKKGYAPSLKKDLMGSVLLKRGEILKEGDEKGTLIRHNKHGKMWNEYVWKKIGKSLINTEYLDDLPVRRKSE